MKKMHIQHHATASDALGNASDRYFPEGHKHFDWQVDGLSAGHDECSGTVRVRYSGPPRPHGEPAHLGSMEYAALAATIAEYALVYLMKLMPEQVARSWVRRLQVKLRQPIDIVGDTQVPFRCRHLRTEATLIALNSNFSYLDIRIGDTSVSMVLDRASTLYHGVVADTLWPPNTRTLHNYGYKFRDNLLDSLVADCAAKTCTARVTLRDEYPFDGNRRGLASARRQVLPTDVLCITGQLMQVLLYALEDTPRHRFPNIWLREADIRITRPLWHDAFDAQVRFIRQDTLRLRDGNWQAIQLESRMQQIEAAFSIAHQTLPRP